MSRWTFLVLTLAACGGAAVCDADELRCSEDGATLEECVEGQWAEAESCGEQGMMCHAEMGHCMMATGT